MNVNLILIVLLRHPTLHRVSMVLIMKNRILKVLIRTELQMNESRQCNRLSGLQLRQILTRRC